MCRRQSHRAPGEPTTRSSRNRRLRREQLKLKSGTCGAAKTAGIHAALHSPDCREKSSVLPKGLAPPLQGATIISLQGLAYFLLSPTFPVESFLFSEWGSRARAHCPAPPFATDSGHRGYWS